MVEEDLAVTDGSIISKLVRLEEDAECIRETLCARQNGLGAEVEENGWIVCEILVKALA